MIPIGKTIKRIERFIIHRILHTDDTPHRLALGLALGIFVAWTPTIGFQMILVLLLAPIFKANGRVGVPVVWVSNPFTLALIYYPNYLLGRWLLGLFDAGSSQVYDYYQLKEQLSNLQGIGYIFRNIFEIELWRELGPLFWNVGLDLWVGSVITGLFLGVVVYIFSYKFIVWYRTHTPLGQLHVLRMLHRKKILKMQQSRSVDKKAEEAINDKK